MRRLIKLGSFCFVLFSPIHTCIFRRKLINRQFGHTLFFSDELIFYLVVSEGQSSHLIIFDVGVGSIFKLKG